MTHYRHRLLCKRWAAGGHISIFFSLLRQSVMAGSQQWLHFPSSAIPEQHATPCTMLVRVRHCAIRGAFGTAAGRSPSHGQRWKLSCNMDCSASCRVVGRVQHACKVSGGAKETLSRRDTVAPETARGRRWSDAILERAEGGGSSARNGRPRGHVLVHPTRRPGTTRLLFSAISNVLSAAFGVASPGAPEGLFAEYS